MFFDSLIHILGLQPKESIKKKKANFMLKKFTAMLPITLKQLGTG